MNISWYHWGFGASCCYVIVGLPIAFYSYKLGQPLTMRTAFYPMMGDRINGWWGDLVELCSVVGTVYGVCTSLGLGVTQIAGGLTRIDNNIDNSSLGVKLVIIWVITAIATCSVVTGLEVGIRRISEINFILGLFILGMIFFFGEWTYLLDFGISEWGYHLNYMFSLSFANDGIYRGVGVSPDDILKADGQFDWDNHGSNMESWMGSWTVFYWAWWISWSPFVGLFIARISKGRTIREFILGNMFVPTLLTCVWLLVFGGMGMYYQMKAEDAGMTCSECEALVGYAEGHIGCMKLSCRGWDADKMLFDMIELFPMKDFMTVVTTLGISLYFVTSSDSASAVIDQISSNGELEGPIWQRVFWAVTEGLTATVVLASAGNDAAAGANALKALRSISLISSLPFSIIMLMMAVVFLTYLNTSQDPKALRTARQKKQFNINIFDSFARSICNSFCCCWWSKKTGDAFPHSLVAVFFPGLLQLSNLKFLGGNMFMWGLALIVPNLGLWVFGIMYECDVDGAFALYGVSWMAFFCVGVALRYNIREKLNIKGSIVGDLCTWMWCGSAAVYQEFMALQKGQVTRWGKGLAELDDAKESNEANEAVYKDENL